VDKTLFDYFFLKEIQLWGKLQKQPAIVNPGAVFKTGLFRYLSGSLHLDRNGTVGGRVSTQQQVQLRQQWPG